MGSGIALLYLSTLAGWRAWAATKNIIDMNVDELSKSALLLVSARLLVLLREEYVERLTYSLGAVPVEYRWGLTKKGEVLSYLEDGGATLADEDMVDVMAYV